MQVVARGRGQAAAVTLYRHRAKEYWKRGVNHVRVLANNRTCVQATSCDALSALTLELRQFHVTVLV